MERGGAARLVALAACAAGCGRIDFQTVGSAGDGALASDASPATFVGQQTAYVKASNTDTGDTLGYGMALSADGRTLAVGAYQESSAATGVDGDQTSNAVSASGAAYVYAANGTSWTQQAYLKASNPSAMAYFGISTALSADGNTLAVGANYEGTTAGYSGAVYVFTRAGTSWSQQAFLKAASPGFGDQFGFQTAISADGDTLAIAANYANSGAGELFVFVRTGTTWTPQASFAASNGEANDGLGIGLALSADGNTLVAGAWDEDSAATGIGGNESDNAAADSGAAYVFVRSGTTWSQETYLKASNTDAGDHFGVRVAISGDASTIAVGAVDEASSATGAGGDQSDNSAASAGAVYVFRRAGATWTQEAYLKASNTDAGDSLGLGLVLSSDGALLVATAYNESAGTAGVDGNQADNSAPQAGASYVFARTGTAWSQLHYVKASNPDSGDQFGLRAAMSATGTIAISTQNEASAATGIDGNQADNTAPSAGAVYTYH